MKKDSIEKTVEAFRSSGLPLIVALVLSLCLFSPQQALAQCENPNQTGGNLVNLVDNDIDNLNLLITQEESFQWNIMQTAYTNLLNYYVVFTATIEKALEQWASQGWFVPMQGTVMELHAAQVDQTYRLGMFDDAQIMTEEQSRKGDLTVNGQKRYMASELACEIDSTGPGLARIYQISRAFNRTLALDDTPRRENATGTYPGINPAGQWVALPNISDTGRGKEMLATWAQYSALFCDPTMGDQGCASPTVPGLLAGRHRDIGAMLWGPQMTIDPTNQYNILAMQASLRYLIDPLASDPIPQSVIPMPNNPLFPQAAAGRSAILERHAEQAYINTIYNTMGGMLSERLGGSGVNLQLMRSGAISAQFPDGVPVVAGDPTDAAFLGSGVPMAQVSTNASYREIQEAMTRDRFNNPYYLVRLISDPVQVARERNVLSALRLQAMNDIYRRQEELLFMESAEYGRDLNGQIPRAELGSIPLHP